MIVMADLILTGRLNLVGHLTLTASAGGRVKVGSDEVLAEGASSVGPPVVIPPPPAKPVDDGTRVVVTASLNKTIAAGGKPIVAGGAVLQGNVPTWPGSILPGQRNATVLINNTPINVQGDQALIAASGALVTLNNSGQ